MPKHHGPIRYTSTDLGTEIAIVRHDEDRWQVEFLLDLRRSVARITLRRADLQGLLELIGAAWSLDP
jgi:hypothetical protein